MTLYRWILFGHAPGVYHLDAPWLPTIPGRSPRHEPACGSDVPPEVTLEPDGTYRCVECAKKLVGC